MFHRNRPGCDRDSRGLIADRYRRAGRDPGRKSTVEQLIFFNIPILFDGIIVISDKATLLDDEAFFEIIKNGLIKQAMRKLMEN